MTVYQTVWPCDIMTYISQNQCHVIYCGMLRKWDLSFSVAWSIAYRKGMEIEFVFNHLFGHLFFYSTKKCALCFTRWTTPPGICTPISAPVTQGQGQVTPTRSYLIMRILNRSQKNPKYVYLHSSPKEKQLSIVRFF